MVSAPLDDDNSTAQNTQAESDLHHLTHDETYDLIYRATREAIWDVLGTATLILFYIVLVAITLSIAVGGIGPFLRGSASYTALGIGVVALVVGVFAAFRVYRLVTE